MQRTDLAALNAFVAVADHLSFRIAASRLGVTPSAVSHAMRQLEERLGVPLLHRTTRGVSLTDAGERLLERLHPAFDQITGALEGVDRERSRPFGRLRIYATNLAAAVVIGPVIGRFLSAYPDVQLELQASQARVDIVARGFDAGIGTRDRVANDMVAVRVMGLGRVAVVAAPAYFAARPPPAGPEDLAGHECVLYRYGNEPPLAEWQFERDGQARSVAVEGRVTVNDAYLALRAAGAGGGLAYVPEVLAEPFVRAGQLARVLEEWSPNFAELFVYYPGRRQVSATLRAFIDMVRARGPVPAGPLRVNLLTRL